MTFKRRHLNVWCLGSSSELSSIDQIVYTPEFLIAKVIQNVYLDNMCHSGKLLDNLIGNYPYENLID